MRDLPLRAARALRLPALAVATVAVAYLAWIGFDGVVSGYERLRLPLLDDGTLGSRVLVISPHPDDESLAAGGLVRQSLQQHRRVMVAVVTCGDGFKRIVRRYASRDTTVSPYLRLGEARSGEARAASAKLGLPASDLVLLGYPDGSMTSLWSADWSVSRSGVNGCESVPYAFAYRPGAPYRGSSVASDLASIIASFSPTAVVYPDAEDANADHWAVAAFTEYALDRAGFRGSRYTYLVHRGHFPFPWSFVPRGWLEPPRTLSRLGEGWLAYPLDSETEREKERALEEYVSQQRAMEPFLAAFVRRNELFQSVSQPVPATSGDESSLDAAAMPGVVLRDPSADTLLRSVDAGADLERVAFVQGPRICWIGVEARSPVTIGVTYRLSSRLIGEEGRGGRMDLEIRGRKAQELRFGHDSVTLPSPPILRIKGKRVWVGIPSSVFAGDREAMISAETCQGGMALDRTAWRSVLLD